MFEASKLKIKRANKHISEFDGLIREFIKTDFCSFGIQKDSAGRNFLKFKMTKEPPCELPLILGDAVHNLRAALDIAYVELITNIGKEPTSWTTFRVWDDRDKLIKTLSEGILKGADDIVSMLADKVCAYAGGDALLCALDSLDIDDKHRLLVPIFNIVKLHNVNAIIRAPGGGTMVMSNCTLGVGNGGVLNVIGMPAGDVDFQGNGNPAFGIFFGDGTSLKGQPIIPTLTQFGQLVGGILEIFEGIIATRAATHGGRPA